MYICAWEKARALTQITASQNTQNNETTDMWSDKQVSVTRLEYKSLYICYGCHTLAQPHSSRGTRRRRRKGGGGATCCPDPRSGFPPKCTGQLEWNNQSELTDTCFSPLKTPALTRRGHSQQRRRRRTCFTLKKKKKHCHFSATK